MARALACALDAVSYDLHEELASTLGIESYRKIPVLSVTPGKRTKRTPDICPWLDGELAGSRYMDTEGGAQVAPFELCTKLMDAALADGATLRIGTVEGVEESADEGGERSVGAVKVDGELVPCKAFVCTMGPWAALAQDWLDLPVPSASPHAASTRPTTDDRAPSRVHRPPPPALSQRPATRRACAALRPRPKFPKSQRCLCALASILVVTVTGARATPPGQRASHSRQRASHPGQRARHPIGVVTR